MIPSVTESHVSQTLLATNGAQVSELAFKGTVIGAVTPRAKLEFLGTVSLLMPGCAATVITGFGKLREVGRSGPRGQGKGTKNGFVGGN